MKLIAILGLIVTGATAAPAQVPPPPAAFARSASGQFTIFGAAPGQAPPPWLTSAFDTNFIQLQPPLLAVSCERIRQKIWAALDSTAPWRGRVFIQLHPVRSINERITIVSERSEGGWDYRVLLADTVRKDRFIDAIVRVLLLEIANRNAGLHPAELPPWLGPGLAEELRASDNLEILLPPPRQARNSMAFSTQIVDERRRDTLEHAQAVLRANPPLSFDQLCWPAEGQLSDDGAEPYRSSAHLFVTLLLRKPDGPARLRVLLEDLPRHYNWQLAFLDAFRDDFPSLLDVEKWWALQVVQFTGHDLSQTWPPAESWRELDEILRSAVDVHTAKDELPLRSEVSLQTILREWERDRQIPVLEHKLAQLDAARLRMAPPLIPLLDQYRQVLQICLRKLKGGGPLVSIGRTVGLASSRPSQEAAQQLDILNLRRLALRPQASSDTTPR
jgi:hypothetical protein